MDSLIESIKACTICQAHLAQGCRPVIQASVFSKIVVIGQAPGSRVHASGIPWDDKSGDNLRNWLGVSKDQFYNPNLFALVPMGFCYPGTGKNGDLPPRSECAPEWHPKLWSFMNQAELTLLVGQYAQKYYLKDNMQTTLTDTVKQFADHLPQYLPLPHPSPRNNIWQKRNPWFTEELLPKLSARVGNILQL